MILVLYDTKSCWKSSLSTMSQKGQESSKIICCSSSYVWHHFKYSGLSANEFENHLHNKNIIQNCQKCFYFPCCKCSKRVSDNQSSIQRDFCKKWVHLKCSRLSYKDFQNYSNSDKAWFCWSCNLANFAFASLNSTEILKLSGSNQKKKNKNLKKGITFCFVCSPIPLPVKFLKMLMSWISYAIVLIKELCQK